MKKLLVVVDYQNDFVSGSLGFPKAAEIQTQICKKIEEYHAAGDTVAFTLDTHQENYLQTQEGKKLPVSHCIRGTQGWALYGKVAALYEKTDLCFEKGIFGSDTLGEYAKKEKFEQIELCGLVSYICVISNAVVLRTALPEAAILVDARCTAGPDEILHEKALDVMQALQIEVLHRTSSPM